MNVQTIKIADILIDDKFNCRGEMAPLDVMDLVKGLKQDGLLNPVLVCPINGATDGKVYKLLAGYRRTKAAMILGWTTISAHIKSDVSEQEAVVLNLSENLSRKSLTLLQEAHALAKLRDLGLGPKQIADKIAMSYGWVQIRFFLLCLPDPVQKEVDAGIIKQTQVRELYTILNERGTDACISAALVCKKARADGKGTQSVNPRVFDATVKRLRNRHEIKEVMFWIYDLMGPQLATRMLAWAIAEITDAELIASIGEEMRSKGKPFDPPANLVALKKYADEG
jgi:ParB/RepB/Spo0J family partition protein